MVLLLSLLFCIVLGDESDAYLSSASVLLPFDTNVKFEVSAFNGCFRWRVGRSNLLNLRVLDETCGLRVEIGYAKYQDAFPTRRETTWIEATDVATQKSYRCEVFLDYVASISIATTTRRLYKDELEMLVIVGLDGAGNQFSSLEGLQVDWDIEKGQSLLSLVPFAEARVKPNQVHLDMEAQGQRSNAILVRGIEGGDVVVSARAMDHASQKVLKVSVALSISFKPLKLSHSQIVVSQGSSSVVGIAGGSLSVQSGGIDVFESSASHLFDIHPLGLSLDGQWRLYRLTCVSLGTAEVFVKAETGAAQDQDTAFQFACMQPYAVYIYPVDANGSSSLPPDCIGAMESNFKSANFVETPSGPLEKQYKVLSGTSLTMRVLAFTQDRRQFDNFSSLSISWVADDADKFLTVGDRSVSRFDLTKFPFPHFAYEQVVQFLDSPGRLGLTLITNRIVDTAAGIRENLKSRFYFSIYRPFALAPASSTVYLHEDNQFNVTVTDGSGHVDLTLENAAIIAPVTTRTLLNEKVITYQPLQEGRVSIIGKDLCSPVRRVESKIRVSRIAKIRLEAHDMVEVGEHVHMKVFAVDAYDEPFALPQYEHIKFDIQLDNLRNLKVDAAYLAVRDDGDANWKGHYVARLKGLASGPCTVTVVAQAVGYEVASAPFLIDVFAPLTLMPRTAFLLPGAQFQLQYFGGPRVPTTIRYVAPNNTGTVSVHPETGLVLALKEGEVKAVITASSAKDGSMVVLGSDEMSIEVGLIASIKLVTHAPSLHEGDVVVVEVRGDKDQTALSWHGLDVRFEWSADDGVQLTALDGSDDLHAFSSVLVRGLRSGRAKISAKIVGSSKDSMLTGKQASLTLTVIDKLPLTPLLLAPQSHYHYHAPSHPLASLGTIDAGRVAFELSAKESKDDEVFVSLSVPDAKDKGSAKTRTVTALSKETQVPSLLRLTTLFEPRQMRYDAFEVRAVAGLYLRPLEEDFAPFTVGQARHYEVLAYDKRGNQFAGFDGLTIGAHAQTRDVAVFRIEASLVDPKLKGYNYFEQDEVPSQVLAHAQPGRAFLSVFGFASGRTLLRVFAQQEGQGEVALTVPLVVLDAVHPQAPILAVGGSVQFSLPSSTLLPLYAHRTAWASSNPQVLALDENGRGYAVAPGLANASFESSLHTRSLVQVLALAKISVGDAALRVSDSLAWDFPLAFYGQKGAQSVPFVNGLGIDHALRFQCAVEELAAPDVLDPLNLTLHVAEKDSACHVALSANGLEDALAYLARTRQDISLIVTSDDVSVRKVLPLSPLFYPSQRQLLFTQDGPHTMSLQLHWRLVAGQAAPAVRVSSTEPLVHVEKESGHYSVTVRKSQYHFVNARIHFTVETTGQSMTVLVSYPEPVTKGEALQNYPLFSFLVALVIIIVSVLFVLRRTKRDKPTVVLQPAYSPTPMQPPSFTGLDRTHFDRTPTPHLTPMPALHARPQRSQPSSPFVPTLNNRFANLNG